MPTSTSSGGKSPDRQTELEEQIKKTEQKLVELQKELEGEKRRKEEEANNKKRKFDDYLALPYCHSKHNRLYSALLKIVGYLNMNLQLWNTRFETYKKICNAIYDLEDVEALNEIWSCIASDQKAIEAWSQPLLLSLHVKITNMKEKALNVQK